MVLRVAIVLDRYDPERGGLERWAHDLARWLAGRGHAVGFVAFDAVAAALPPGVALHLVASPPGRLRRAAAAARLLDELGADVVHDLGVGWRYDVLQPQGGSKLASARAAVRALPPLGRLLRRCDSRHWRRLAGLAALERRQYGAAHGIVIAVSQLVRSDLERRFATVRGRIRTVPNGVDVARFAPDRHVDAGRAIRQQLATGDAALFLTAGHNLRLKGVATALRAVRLLRDRGADVRLAVIGRGDAGEPERLARRLGIADRVSFCGHVADQRPYLAAADVLLHPTFYDACSLVVLEAWAAGVPVITTARNGAAELMTDGLEGVVVRDPASAAEVAAAMAATLDGARRAAMGESARRLALRHSLEANFAAVEDAYREAMALRQGDPACRR